MDKKIFLVKGNVVSIPIAKLPNDILMRTYLEGEWIELTDVLEEEMFKELREKFYDIDYFTFKQTIQKFKEEVDK
jgi:hypothetical protein